MSLGFKQDDVNLNSAVTDLQKPKTTQPKAHCQLLQTQLSDPTTVRALDRGETRN